MSTSALQRPSLCQSALLVLALSCAGGCVAADRADSEAEARTAVEHYLQGHATGSRQSFESAFHPEARLYGVRAGRFESRTGRDYIERAASGQPPADEHLRRRQIQSLNVTGEVATAVVVLDYPHMQATDHLALLRIDGQWQIVAKVYDVE